MIVMVMPSSFFSSTDLASTLTLGQLYPMVPYLQAARPATYVRLRRRPTAYGLPAPEVAGRAAAAAIIFCGHCRPAIAKSIAKATPRGCPYSLFVRLSVDSSAWTVTWPSVCRRVKGSVFVCPSTDRAVQQAQENHH